MKISINCVDIPEKIKYVHLNLVLFLQLSKHHQSYKRKPTFTAANCLFYVPINTVFKVNFSTVEKYVTLKKSFLGIQNFKLK